jgi:S-adenosylmethionine-dependent methyltransferase
LALAEQGAIVTGIDIDEASIQVAKNRAQLYDADYTIFQENATNINKFSDQSFDFIIFFAALEHMTINERIDSLKKAWSQLSKGAILVIIETPNRLWFRDGHTSLLPFFHWLPDQLAFYYSSMSPRNNFYRFANDIGNEVPETFHRLGRGASYHEFEIAMGKDALSNVVGDLDSFMLKNPLCALKNVFYKGNGYYNLIKQINPQIHSSFFHQDLNLAIGKK